MTTDQQPKTQPSKDSECWCNGTGGTGVVFNRVGYKFTAEYCSCESGKSLQQSERSQSTEMYAEMERKQAVRIWENSEIPLRFVDFTLETSPHVLPVTYDEQLQGSWYFWGEVSRGKTGLAVGIARALVEKGLIHQLCFVSVPDLLSALRDTYSDADASELGIINRYADVELLILDDMGAEQSKNTEWIQDRLYQIINRRHGEVRPTIFTSNLNLEDLGSRIGARNAWRIRELVGDQNIIEIKGKNLRV